MWNVVENVFSNFQRNIAEYMGWSGHLSTEMNPDLTGLWQQSYQRLAALGMLQTRKGASSATFSATSRSNLKKAVSLCLR